MGWFSRRREAPAEEPPEERVERLVTRSRKDSESERTTLDDRETVARWVRGLRPDQDVQVWVERSWGSIVAVAGNGDPPSVLLAAGEGESTWYAGPPGGGEKADLTQDQLEQLMLEALSSPGPPTWPDWHQLT